MISGDFLVRRAFVSAHELSGEGAWNEFISLNENIFRSPYLSAGAGKGMIANDIIGDSSDTESRIASSAAAGIEER